MSHHIETLPSQGKEQYVNINPLQSSADKIQEWRDANPSRELTFYTLCRILGVSYLTGMSLTNANLTGADLYGADLTNVNLTGADLTGVNLTGVNLHDARLCGADLTNANLYDANLAGADLTNANLTNANLTFSVGGVAQISNVYPHPVNIQPTPDGWYVRVGFWYGTLDALHDIATSDDEADWPEACGGIREERQPLLQAILGVFDAHVANHPNAIDRLAERWGYRECAC